MDHAEAALARDSQAQLRQPIGTTAAVANVVLYSPQPPIAVMEALKSSVAGKGEAIAVEVNHGRWVVECPDCHGAQLASTEDPRFMCHLCLNVAVAMRWRKVIWPRNHHAISEALADRPVENQNWTPAETLADLRAETGPAEEPTDPREHALWAGLDPEAAKAWERECIAADKWIRAVKDGGA